ncbi:MAG TPA: nucleotidyltransferase [Algoriphagus sp.]|jgi:dTDP-glucose pyrophosphorylase|uniref:nucleotidyltransferase family protein n=1 Tax=unclassified Algoriphagus TaxID=2641541 RepID=UPI000C544061|nr:MULTISPECIES: sugar phosphate nucleotidyltransferase [unclassified Algoriphagus]MAL14609.1 nucleotidyltransferase [Algoriphagus sp.]MAN87634.1 nucleotidyltransferase [Algoriphagus sp.]QYH40651.1 nucleotidyltransferase [Algoriphagus sp. NBT04N3]HAD50932.1 nucleotidyltransferase [Algoriphagus sp.]HAH37957.1 nucleotidyltransferase [Algoriphagus sp.]|tara:strand:+ start:1336 stop:2241 length:906 start_codon:yes stop_codon:yes gene_type:complete
MTQKPTLVVLAAGMGSRYGGNKQIDGFGPNGETILEYSIFDAIRAGFGKVVFIVRQEILDVAKEKFLPKLQGKIEVDWVIQSLDSFVPAELKQADRVKPFGTAHAVLCAKDAVKEPFAVINADDFYGKEAFEEIGKFLSKDARPHLHAMVGYAIQNVLSENGTVSRGVCETNEKGQLIGMTERTSIAREGGKILSKGEGEVLEIAENTPVSMNFWGFHPDVFVDVEQMWKDFLPANKENLKSEFYIPTVANNLIQSGKAAFEILPGGKTWFGVTYTEDKPVVIEALKSLHDSGEYPAELWK